MIEPVRARRIRLVGMDVDGTMTDGGVYIGAPVGGDSRRGPIEMKRFDIQDGLGITLLKMTDIKVVIITGRASNAAKVRAKDLGADEFVSDPTAKKLPAMQSILHKYNLRWEEIAFIGDDIADLPVMRRVGLPVAVANAVAEVKEIAVHTTAASGGHGAVREFIEGLLKARGAWSDVVKAYLKERGDGPAR